MSGALIDAWERTLRRHADRRAAIDAAGGRTLTFREIDTRARAWSEAHLPEDRRELSRCAVVFSPPNGTGWLEMFLALLRAGSVVVPADPAEPPSARRELAMAIRAGFWWDGARLEKLGGARRYRDPGTCLIKLTSGTTGKPRPLVFTAAQMLADARQVTATMGIAPTDLNYALIPLGHSYGLGNLVLPLISQGTPIVFASAPLPGAIAADFARWKPTVFPGVPALWRALAASEVSRSDLGSLRLGISAGSPLLPETAREFETRFRRRLHNFYGSSETGGIAFDRDGESTLAGGVGSALRGVGVKALGAGRIQVCSAAVFTQGNRQRRGRFGVWTPPDRAMLDSRGGLTLCGRRGTTVKIAGKRVNPVEIVACLRSVAGVTDAWVGSGPGANPQLGAAVATRRGASELRAALQQKLALWKIPKKWVLMPKLPINATGKIDARALRGMLFGDDSDYRPIAGSKSTASISTSSSDRQMSACK